VILLSGAATARAIWNGNFCMVVNLEHTKIAIFTTFVSDLILLLLMVIGLLRWENVRQRGGVLSSMCTQVDTSH
jgi:hypothetical protein